MASRIWRERPQTAAMISVRDYIGFIMPRLSREEMLQCADLFLNAVRDQEMTAMPGAMMCASSDPVMDSVVAPLYMDERPSHILRGSRPR